MTQNVVEAAAQTVEAGILFRIAGKPCLCTKSESLSNTAFSRLPKKTAPPTIWGIRAGTLLSAPAPDVSKADSMRAFIEVHPTKGTEVILVHVRDIERVYI